MRLDRTGPVATTRPGRRGRRPDKGTNDTHFSVIAGTETHAEGARNFSTEEAEQLASRDKDLP